MASKFVLLEVRLPTSDDFESVRARDANDSAAKDLPSLSKGIEPLGGYAWLIDLQTHVPFLSRICSTDHSVGASYRLLFLEQEPEWITYGEWK